ncbi:MAG: Tetratricopeptide 2 repeat protein [Hyphomicrobiales bacterium]|nr:Tetratricopeptide 2 repeat protein [Hyphomicrobiales bacterium]
MNPRIAGYYDNRKSALQSLGRYAEALDDANAAIARASGYAFVYRSRGLLFEDMQRFEAGILDFDRALSINPTDYGMVVDRARMKVRAGRAGEAVRDLSQVILLDPANNRAYRERGFAYLSSGDKTAAASDLALFARAVPGDEFVARALADLAAGSPARR